MRYYLAPMEGITTDIYRAAYHKYFWPMEKYFTPFLVPHSKKGFSAREMREIDPARNEGMNLVPQIMSNQAGDCLRTMKKLKDLGYQEVNLNFGCPSRTVVSKNRGAGFLADPEALEHFLEEVFAHGDQKISVKTRLGKYHPEEFEEILAVYNRYPLEELILHPRTQQDFYQGRVNLEAYAYAREHSRNPLCYNGDIRSASDGKRLTEQFPGTDTVMLGRGVIANPALVEQMEGRAGEELDGERLKAFLEEICEGYQELGAGERPVLFKMKELWAYLTGLFPESQKQAKKIRKSGSLAEYQAAVEEVFALHSPRAAL